MFWGCAVIFLEFGEAKWTERAGALGTFREAIGMNDNGPVIPYLGEDR